MNTIRRKWSRLLLVPLICIALILLCGCSGAGKSASTEPQKLQELSAQEKESGTEEDRETGTGSEGEGSGSGDEDYYENDDEDYLTDEDPPEEDRDTQKSGADIDENGVYTTKEDVALYLHTYGHLPHNFMTKKEARSLCGINFPKFNAENGYEYFAYLLDLNEQLDEVLYGMPIIEDPEVAYKETRISELIGIRKILDKYHRLVLQVRVGGTDFSSVFGVRRGVDYSLYDIMVVRECLSDIINVCARNNDYVVSGPVWEYFRAPKELMFEELPKHGLEDYLMRRKPMVNNEIDGLLREVILDKANGFIGRTVIHPTHVKFVNALMAVTKEQYDDARQILGTGGGVVKGSGGNKMNEIRPHTNWANKIYNRGRAFGVIENEAAYIKLFAVNE